MTKSSTDKRMHPIKRAVKGRRKRHSSLFALYAVLCATSIGSIWLYFHTTSTSNTLLLVELASISVIFVCCLFISIILKQEVLPQLANIISLVVLGVVFVFMLQGWAEKPTHHTLTRNQIVSAALHTRHVSYLLGDFWRIAPIGEHAKTSPLLIPVTNCTHLDAPLAHKQIGGIENNSFAYLLTLDKTLGNQPGCTLNDIERVFGIPNATIVVSGTPAKPHELLLFYDNYAGQPQTATNNSPSNRHALNVRKPIECQAKSIMSFVAHEDDDLLFMNPDLSTRIRDGYCVTTVYMTAGDNGTDPFYWLQRRQGSESAYNIMLGRPADSPWSERIVQLAPNQYLTLANPVDNPYVTLFFVNLPDGNVRGGGFERTEYQSLSKLWASQNRSIRSVDNQSTFTLLQLTSLMTTLLRTYSPEEVWTQSYADANTNDHADHMTTGMLTTRALAQYNAFGGTQSPNVRYYLGYPIRNLPINLSDDEANMKAAIFFTYAEYDSTICPEHDACVSVGTYSDYLYRQYTDQPAP